MQAAPHMTGRIALVGPMAPYRGGIAQYNDRLRAALAEQCQVLPVSFTRQYPAWLYPGTSDLEPESRGRRSAHVAYVLDACSPRSWHRSAELVASEGCELAIISWWTLFWAPGMARLARLLRRRGVATAFLCHNLFDHDAKGVRRRASEWLLGSADAYIVHSAEQAVHLGRIARRKPVLHRQHPAYDHFPAPDRLLPKRGRLELLFFGFIRPYKGLEVLIKALEIMQDHSVYLTVIGEAWGKAQARQLHAMAQRAPNVELRMTYVAASEAAEHFSRADIVVLPYLSATGSGVVGIAYHYRKPVLASRVGGLVESVLDSRTGWMVPPGSPAALAEAISGLTREDAAGMSQSIDGFVRDNTWERMAEAICNFAPGVIAGAGAGRAWKPPP